VVGVAMGWRHVLFASWPVEPTVVEPHLPAPLSVDTFDGDAWLSVVPYTNVAVRPRGLPAALGVRLPELNLRTYVTCDGEPGVHFFSLDADGLLGVVGARLLHGLPYYCADVTIRADGETVSFDSRRRHPGARAARVTATYGRDGDRRDAAPGSRAHFLTERYRYYAEAPDGGVRYADVEHPPWPLYPATASLPTNTLFRANAFAAPDSDPVFHYSPGVDVVTTGRRRWPPAGESP
jgi:uncharacterized protein YqjF (DUF2071 family)